MRGRRVCSVGARGCLERSCARDARCELPTDGEHLSRRYRRPCVRSAPSSQLSGNLTRAELRLRNFSGDGDWIFQIRTAQPSGSFSGELEPTPTVLASATLPDASVPDGMDSTESVVFPSPAAVVAGGDYALSVTRPAATDANSLAVAAHSPHTDCPSRMYDSNNGGTNWSGQDLDTIFRVFVTPPVPVPPVPPATPVTTAKKKCKKKKKQKRSAESAKKKKCKKK